MDEPTSTHKQFVRVDGNHSVTKRFAVLDGWRAASILLVLAAHLLPLGPKSWRLNSVAALSGMTLFFALSGFLVTRSLARGMPLDEFAVHRTARILPLAWLALAIALPMAGAGLADAVFNLTFLANFPPYHILSSARHFWSLQVEMQFYAAIALLVWVSGRRGLYVLPLLGLLITLARIAFDQPDSIDSWFRIDEILAGSGIALIHEGWLGKRSEQLLKSIGWGAYPLIILALLAGDLRTEPLNYLRPYIVAAMVGGTLYRPPARLRVLLESRGAAYIASISYALYVIHGIATSSWLGSGTKWVMYVKRPLLIAITWCLAHLSTRYFERPINGFARRMKAGPRSSG